MLFNLFFFIFYQVSLNGVHSQGDFKCGLESSCVFGNCKFSRCAGDECSARQSNIQGDLLILDYNSLIYNAGPNHPPSVTNPARCCDRCKETKGCNAWVFCSNKDGCGSGCQDYISSLSNPDAAKDVRKTDARFIPFPIPGFGQFASCNGDKWPWLMCSLKTVQDINSPTEKDAEDGWVSGVIKTDSVCVNSPVYELCNACQRSADPYFCNQCVAQVPKAEQLLCAQCANLSTPQLRNHCVECLKNENGSEDGCGKCAKFDTGAEQCFQCTINEANFDTQRGCVNCQEWVPGQQECMQDCVKLDTTPFHAKPECNDCYQTSNPQRCVQCLQESQEGGTKCSACSSEECFSCLSQHPKSKEARLGCSNCMSSSTKTSDEPKCYACVANPKIKLDAKELCGDCVAAGADLQKRSSCFKCLEVFDYYAPACPDCLKYASDPDRCFECVKIVAPRGQLVAWECADCANLDILDQRTTCYACMEDAGKAVAAVDMCSSCFSSFIQNTETCLNCLKTAKTQQEVWDVCW